MTDENTTEQTPVALISGAGRGTGRAIALRLAREGFDIAGLYARDDAAADTTRADVESAGVRCRMYRCDVADASAVAECVAEVVADFGHLDVLVHNAGIASRGKTVADTDPAEVTRVVGVHAFGAFHLLSAAIPSLRKSDRAAVVLVSSTAAATPAPGNGPYTLGKVALEALGRTVAAEEARHGIRVNIVAPGLIVTEMGDRLARAVTGAADAAELDARMPFGRVTRPEDVAETIEFLVSERARQITGQRIEVHGGVPGVPKT
ncbi:SDR family NAD(P)-dependent oxidoreductase [Rhodococcus sp. NPDC003382]|uniref:SDR family NAD(P)-dependent oxidoreductase n=1 Tax=Rhodococcus sp. HM1 TaxID=2937759 RepID=UPI00200AB30D|nr:SDR family oxidoreductase [Rhodococcus sp. HM1]MCK8669825.1 SDR family oxidoreductase [Rhodococcus sp. HM1]